MKREHKALLGMVALLSGKSPWAHADLKDLIREHKNDTAVITPIPGKQDDNGYGILVLSPSDYAAHVGLLSPDKLENDHFKVVEFKVTGKTPLFDPAPLDSNDQLYVTNLSDEALSTTDFDGDNVLYHLSLAHDFYAKLATGSGFTDEALDQKVLVRVRATQDYNLVTHAGQHPDYNNSRTIPGNYRGAWNPEIWFDAPKKELMGMNWYDFATSSGLAIAQGSWEAGVAFLPLQLYQHYNAGLDPSKMPDVIYHEAFHYATDAPGLFPIDSRGNPVAEDYASYFGSSIVGRPEMAEINEFSSRFYKHSFNRIVDVKDTSPSDYNANPFGPSMFWQIRKWLGQERADQLLWNSIHYLNESSKHTDVPLAVSAAAHADHALSIAEVQQIDDLLARHAQSYENLELKFNPGEALAKLDEAEIRAQGARLARAIRQIPEEVPLSDEDKQTLNETADSMEALAQKPNFKSHVLASLHAVASHIERGAIDTGKGVSYVGSALSAASQAPLTFGADFTSGLFLGHGLVSEREQSLLTQLVSAGGGVSSVYYAYTGLAALGFTMTLPLASSAMGVSIVNRLVCAKADPHGVSERDRYCVQNGKIMQLITSDVAKSGGKSGKFIRRGVIRISNFFKAPFRKKQG